MHRCPHLDVTAVFDFARGCRRTAGLTSMDILAPLPKRARIGCFRMPQQATLLGRTLPPRWAEGVGVQHVKCYVFDDTVVLTGANLSSDYFTSRQDRCVIVSGNVAFADAAHALVGALYDASVPSTALHMAASLADRSGQLADFLAKEFGPPAGAVPSVLPSADTVIVTPLAQFKCHGVRQDEHAMLWLLRSLPADAQVHVATGYFNLTPDLRAALLHSSAASLNVLTAAPSANGFFGAPGADFCVETLRVLA
jgi:CDP-diacylglycerol--glycerol-3-phosphate 3-phosphatidyltransferase